VPNIRLNATNRLTRNKCSSVAEKGDRLATVEYGPRSRGCAPFYGEAWSASNIMPPGPRPTSVPSGILIHPAGWHNRHGPKIVGLCAVEGSAGSHLTQCSLVRDLPYLCIKWHPNPSNCLATIDQHYRQDMQDRQRDMTDNGPIA